jgi:hypothetical protein
VHSSLSVILQRDSQDKSPAGQYLQLKTGGNLIYTVRNWAGELVFIVIQKPNSNKVFLFFLVFLRFVNKDWSHDQQGQVTGCTGKY